MVAALEAVVPVLVGYWTTVGNTAPGDQLLNRVPAGDVGGKVEWASRLDYMRTVQVWVFFLLFFPGAALYIPVEVRRDDTYEQNCSPPYTRVYITFLRFSRLT